MRTLEGHKVNPANDVLQIAVLDEPGAGGANHHYQITGFNTKSNPSDPFTARHGQPAEHATVQDAQSALLERTRERMARNVEGTHQA